MSFVRSVRVYLCFITMIVSCTFQGQNLKAQINEDLEPWLQKEIPICISGLKKNITHPKASPGAVIASPSERDPNYFFHWVRDAALVMNVVVGFYENAATNTEKIEYKRLIDQFIEFSKKNQLTPNRSNGLGEPKFNVDGSAFNEEWGRPQNDGPALRAVTLIRYAKLLLQDQANQEWVKNHLYDSKLPTQSVIKRDLEFVSHQWREASFDLWEEVRGQHFYTRMVQRRALLDGASLADDLGDPEAGKWYRLQAKLLEEEIDKHWDPQRNYILTTLDYQGGSPIKKSNIDAAIILASLHGDRGDGYLNPSHERVLNSAYQLREKFIRLYEVNLRNPELGVAIGRYPEDVYDGYSVGVGNPWVLTTAAYAELYYRVALDWKREGKITVTQLNRSFINMISSGVVPSVLIQPGKVFLKGSAEFDSLIQGLMKNGDLYLYRIKLHTPLNGALAEQINRTTGYMQGAADLTWSYASVITAFESRIKLNDKRK